MLKNIFDKEGLKKKADDIKDELRTKRIIAESGGGMVKIEVNGLGEVIDLKIEESIINSEEKEMLEDLIIAAFNKSKEKLNKLWQQEMEKMLGGIPLPGLGDFIA